MTTRYGIEYQRIDGRFHAPVVEFIPAEVPPAEELETFLQVMTQEVGAQIREMSPGRWAVHLTEADQVWSVRVVSVGDPGKTAQIAAVDTETDEVSK